MNKVQQTTKYFEAKKSLARMEGLLMGNLTVGEIVSCPLGSLTKALTNNYVYSSSVAIKSKSLNADRKDERTSGVAVLSHREKISVVK